MPDGTTGTTGTAQAVTTRAPEADLDRSVLVARLASGRALLALVTPFAVAALLVRLIGAGVLVAVGAVVEDGEVVTADPRSVVGFVVAVVGVVVLELAALLGVGGALVVLAREAVREPVRWREVWTWPARHARAAWALGGAGLLLQVAGVAAPVLVAVLLSWATPEAPGWAVLVATWGASLAAVAGLFRVVRSAADLLVVGTLSHPGVIRARWVWGKNRRVGGTVLGWGAAVLAITLLLQAQRSGLGWPMWTTWAILWPCLVALVLVVLAMLVDDSAREHGMPPRQTDRRAGAIRWGSGAAVLFAPLLVLALLVQIDPFGLVRYQRLEIGPMSDVPVAAAGGGTLIERDDARFHDRTAVMCQGARCVDLGFARSQTATTLSEDGSTVWAAAWEYDDPYGADPVMTLHLRAYPVDDLDRVAVGGDGAPLGSDGELLRFPSGDPTVDLVVAEDRAEVMHPGEIAHAYLGQTMTAVAERDGVLVVASSYNSMYDRAPGPMYLARCTADGCDTTRTTHVMTDAPQQATVDAAIGPDGTGYVTAFGSTPDGSTQDTGLVGGVALFVLDPSGDLGTHQIAEGDPGRWGWEQGPDLVGADVVVADDGTVWVLTRTGFDFEGSLLRCTDASCGSWDTTTVPAVSQGLGVLGIDGTGRPMIASASSGEVALLSCTDDRCTTTERRTLVTTELGRVPALGLVVREGRPVLLLHDPSGGTGGSRALACVEARCGAD